MSTEATTVIHCCDCRTDHVVQEDGGMKFIACSSAPPNTMYFLNTKYFTRPECVCGIAQPEAG